MTFAASFAMIGWGIAPPAPVVVEPVPAADVSVADPRQVHIPAIGVAAETIPLGLDAKGAFEVPTDFAQAGWYRGGPEPGEPGAAVIVGHVDSRQGPAVFFQLRELRPGDEVQVETHGGQLLEFVVERVEQHPKNAFPTEAVYGQTFEPTLRLITCAGGFDRTVRGYRDNIVVFARLATSGD